MRWADMDEEFTVEIQKLKGNAGSSRHAAADGRSDNPKLRHQLSERFWLERLRAVGKRMLWIVVYFDEQTVRTRGDRSARHRWNFVAAAGSVRRIAPHRQMRKFLDNRYCSNVEGVARVGFECTDSALTQDYIVVSAGEDVFRGEQEFLHCCGKAALQQNWLSNFAQSPQQKIVLHVSRPNLIDVHVLTHHFDLPEIHHLADSEQAELVGGFAHQLQALFAESLECIGRSARLERSGTQNLRSCLGYGFRNGLHLLA